ncbi:hypothetical protein [Actinoplanes sp. NPDC023714]|uniref:hypothetical protein n=1 Tax=Actinoplanes sp. NPDC023714 TaxID=3154322 RepID=UPI0033CAC624
MRKLWCAGAIAGGILLFGASPALAASPDPLDPIGADPIGAALRETGDWRVNAPLASDPLSGEPLVDLSLGEKQARGGKLLSLQPGHNSVGRTEKTLPAADVVSGTLPSSNARSRTPGTVGRLPNPAPAAVAAGELAFSALPFDSLMNSGSTVVTALGPDGVPVAQNNRIDGLGEPLKVTRTEKAGNDVPLVGGIGTAGLGGALPVAGVRRLGGLDADLSGLPLGGSPIDLQSERSAARPGTPDPDTTTPATPGTTTPNTPGTTTPATPDTAAPNDGQPGATPPASGSTTGDPAAANKSDKSDKSDDGGGKHDAPAAGKDGDKAGKHSATPSKQSKAVTPRDRIDDPRLLEEPTEGLN